MADRPLGTSSVPRLGKGSLFLNNTSYSGADIKVVINVYEPGKALREDIKLAEEGIRKAQQDLKTLQSQISAKNDQFNAAKVATPLWNKLSSELGRMGADYQVNQLFIQQEQERLTKLRKETPKTATKVLAEMQTLSVSTHRDKVAVRSCGTVYPRGFTRGPRQIAGSAIFTVFDEHVLFRFLEAHASDFDAIRFTSALLDQLPPVDILVSFANEYGQVSRMTIYGVEFIDEGQVMSIEDIMTENVVQWVARDIDPMRSVSSRFTKQGVTNAALGIPQPTRASDLILEEDYQKIKNSLDPFTRFRRRRNPFL